MGKVISITISSKEFLRHLMNLIDKQHNNELFKDCALVGSWDGKTIYLHSQLRQLLVKITEPHQHTYVISGLPKQTQKITEIAHSDASLVKGLSNVLAEIGNTHSKLFSVEEMADIKCVFNGTKIFNDKTKLKYYMKHYSHDSNDAQVLSKYYNLKNIDLLAKLIKNYIYDPYSTDIGNSGEPSDSSLFDMMMTVRIIAIKGSNAMRSRLHHDMDKIDMTKYSPNLTSEGVGSCFELTKIATNMLNIIRSTATLYKALYLYSSLLLSDNMRAAYLCERTVMKAIHQILAIKVAFGLWRTDFEQEFSQDYDIYYIQLMASLIDSSYRKSPHIVYMVMVMGYGSLIYLNSHLEDVLKVMNISEP